MCRTRTFVARQFVHIMDGESAKFIVKFVGFEKECERKNGNNAGIKAVSTNL